MPVERIFLGWDRPLLPAVAQWLIREASGSYGDWTVVFPSKRALRRFPEILLDRGEGRKDCLALPWLLTPETLADRLAPPPGPAAPSLVRRHSFVTALRRLPSATRDRFLPRPPASDDLAAWLRIAREIQGAHDELAANGLAFSDVARRLPADAVNEVERWRSLAQLQSDYVGELASHGLCDARWERRESPGEPVDLGNLVLAGVVEFPAVLRRTLERYPSRCVALIHAPAASAHQFGSLGELVVEAWQQVSAPIADDQIRVVGSEREEAAEVVAAVRELAPRYSTDEIVIGAADMGLAPLVREELATVGVAVRAPQDTTLRRSSLGQLLVALERYLRRPTFAHLASLARHPEFDRRLGITAKIADPLTKLDKYFSNRLPQGLDGLAKVSDESDQKAAEIHAAAEKIVGPLRGPTRTPAQWAQPISKVLADIYGREQRHRHSPADHQVVEACEIVRAGLDALRGVPATVVGSISAADAVLWLLSEIEGTAIPELADDAAIDLVGWLELAADDAPAVIVVGCNDESVPGSFHGHLFLGDALRRRLGLPDNRQRLARDMHHLSAMASCRPFVRLIAGRVGRQGDPLRPSRLFLIGDPLTAARRLLPRRPGVEKPPTIDPPEKAPREFSAGQLRLFDPAPGSAALGPWEATWFPETMPTSMRVTSFRDYLHSPYRYYLKYILSLRESRDDATELNPMSFGNLIHAALQALGRLSPEELRVASRVEEALDAEALDVAKAAYGDHAPPAVAIQVEQARQRLRALARRQAIWANEGWVIDRTEWTPSEEAALLDVDGEPMRLSGRVDRLDYHPDRRCWAVLDYKAGDHGADVKSSHIGREGFTDVQLPLYRYLARGEGREGPIYVGYVLLPKALDHTRFDLADWPDSVFDAAMDAARDVVRKIRRREFALAPPKKKSKWADEFAVLCHETFTGRSPVFDDEADE